MFEHRTDLLLTRRAFAWRLFRSFLITVLIVALSMLAGTWGFHWCDDQKLEDAFHQACLVLGDQGLHDPPASAEGKLFAGFFVMYSSLVFFAVARS